MAGKKDARTNGDYSGFSGVRIVIAVECGVVFGIVLIVLVVFWKRKELKNSQLETKPAGLQCYQFFAMWQLALLFWISSIATLTKGQGVSQPQSAPPRIVDFFKGNLIKPEEVKSGKAFNAAKNWGFRLLCDAQGPGNPLEWRWQRNETDIVFPHARYTLGAYGLLTGSLLTAEDSGNYQCFVKDTITNKETFSRKVQVAVTYVDDFVTKTDIAQTVNLGDPFSFNCPPHGGSYGASYTWANKENTQLNRDEHIAITSVGTLHIMFITQTDVDKISALKGIACTIVAANTIYQSGLLTVTRSTLVDPGMQRTPSWEVNSLSKSLEIAVEGRNKTLYCLAVGRPAPKITWKKDGHKITKGQNSYDIPDIFFGRQLKIIDVKKDKHESTNYTCEAENSVNSGNPLSHEINLKVVVAPRWRIKAPTWKLEVDILGNGSLLCDVYADPVPSFKWYKDGKRILSSNQYVVIDDEKLRIQNARLQEDGVYQCVAENKHGMIVSSTWIYIRAKAPTFLNNPLGPFYLFKNSQGVLKCEPEAAPPPTFEWFRNGEKITTGGRYIVQKDGVLLINVVTENDKGEYRCKARNIFNTTEDVGAATVFEKTRITVKPDDKIVLERVNIDLRCRAEADSRLELKYYWRRDNAVVQYNSKIEWLEEENVLKISDISVNDAGIYTCVAYTPEPRKSEDQASAKVYVKGVPFPPVGLKVNEKTCIDRTTVLEWITIPSDDAPILHFLVEQESNHEPDVFYLLYNETNPNAISVLLNLTGWSTLRFRMRAVNSFGPSRPSLSTEPGICRTSQSAPERFPENLRGVPKGANELAIAWTKLPKAYWNGPGFHYFLEYKKVVEPANEDFPDKWEDTRILAEGSSFKIDNPGHYELWEFRIRAGNNLGPGPFSAIERSRSGQEPPEGQPKDVKVGKIQARNVELLWQPVDAPARGSVDGYRIFYWYTILSVKTRRKRRAIPSYANYTDVKGRTTSSTAVLDLKPYTSYTVAIKAFNSGGKGPASYETHFDTLQDVPGPPSDVKVYPFALYILVTWKPPVEPNGIIKNYQAGSAKFKGSEPKDTPVEMTELETSKRRYLIGKEVKQEELTNYVVEIQAKTEPGYGASVRIPTKTVKVSAPAKPKAPTVEPTAIDKVRVTYIFGIGGGYTHEFLVQYRLKLENEEFVNSSWVNYLNDEFDLEIGDLESALYQFRIIARNDQGESPPTEITEARPMPGILGVPFPPTSLKINEKTCINRTTVLEWTTVPSNDAPVLHFLIEQESNHEPNVFYLLYNVTNPNATSVVLNLTGWSTLRFRMRAVNSFGTSRHSLPTEAGICRTSQAAPEKFPENLRGAPKRAGELDITWTKMPKVYWNGPGFYYLLEYKNVLEPVNEDSPGQWQNKTIPAELSSFKIHNPGYYELWEFRICAGNNLGQGPFSGIERSRFGQDPPQGKPKDAKSSVAIVIAVGCGVVFGIFLILFVVFCKRRQLKNSQQQTKPAVLFRHSVVEICDEIPVERPMGRESTPTEQDSQLTYRRPVNNSGESDDGTMCNTSEHGYGYCHVYQSVDEN